MYAAFYQASHALDLNLVSSVFFGVFFLGVLAWVATRGQAACEAEARKPLAADLADEPSPHLTSAPENAR